VYGVLLLEIFSKAGIEFGIEVVEENWICMDVCMYLGNIQKEDWRGWNRLRRLEGGCR